MLSQLTTYPQSSKYFHQTHLNSWHPQQYLYSWLTFHHSNSNLSNNNPLPLNNPHLSHLQEDHLQQQEHKHKLLNHLPPSQWKVEWHST